MPRAIERLAAGKNRNTTAGRGFRHGKRLFANGMFPGGTERRAIGFVAQLVERLVEAQGVVGSNPAETTSASRLEAHRMAKGKDL